MTVASLAVQRTRTKGLNKKFQYKFRKEEVQKVLIRSTTVEKGRDVMTPKKRRDGD